MAAPTILPPLVDPESADTQDDVLDLAPVEASPARLVQRGSEPRSGFGTTVLPEVDNTARRPVLRERSAARFRITSELGVGGLGEVLGAVDDDIGRRVAIKRIRPDRMSRGALLRFLQEIRTVGRLEHPNILPIHDVGRDDDGNLYFVMRYVDGETLERVIERLRAGDRETHERFGFERRVRIVAAVLEALDFAHRHGVVHRDIKPANVMIGRYGEVLLLDWGIARLLDRVEPERDEEAAPGSVTETRAGAVIGTPAYMSPEQARGEPVDGRSDLYAASVMLHEFLTLRHYLEGCESTEEMLQAAQTRTVPLAAMVRSAHQGAVPMDLAWFVERGVRKDPADRYQSAQEMLDRLARRAEGDIPVQCHVTLTKQAAARTLSLIDRHLMLASALMMLAIVGAVGSLGGLVLLALTTVAFAAP